MKTAINRRKPTVIAIDGPSASGKGTLAAGLADHYRLDRLESGLLYRAVAYELIKSGGDLENEADAEAAAKAIDHRRLGEPSLRLEEVSAGASKVAELAKVRRALLEFQRRFGIEPPNGRGAVIDGRDIGTVVFADAEHKLFLTASPQIRAERRLRQLRQSGIEASLDGVLRHLRQRDRRDADRSLAPLKRAADAVLIDSSDLTAAATLNEAIRRLKIADK